MKVDMIRTKDDNTWRFWCWLVILPILFSGCRFVNKEKRLNRRITLWRQDKIPYGCYAAYQNLPFVFPNANIKLNKRSPIFLDGYGASKKVYIIISSTVDPNASELRGLMNFVGQGNTVFISSFRFGDSLLRSLNIQTAANKPVLLYRDSIAVNSPVLSSRDSLRLSVYDPLTHDSLSYVYPGNAYNNYATAIDSQYASILGRDVEGHPDFIRMTYKGGGALYLHFAPLAFTNFFLLHKENMAYYDKVFSYLPVSATEVKWDDYFRRPGTFSAFGYINQSTPLRWALWLVLLLFLLIYLFESKRRQRKIPVIPALSNTSLDFVKTIGRLYYQRRDNRNLALKMAAHFQDMVRTRYNLLISSMPDEELISRLSHKTDLSREFLREIVTAIRGLQEERVLSDEELLEFSGKLNQFYKQV